MGPRSSGRLRPSSTGYAQGRQQDKSLEEFRMYDLKGRVALVTGAGPNIGRVIAATLAGAGATVLCNDLRPEIAAAAAKSASEAGKAFPLPFDITDPDKVEHAIEVASREH